METTATKESHHVIYGLFDPLTKELRYIGYTSNMTRRYWQHYSPESLEADTHKNNWLKSLLTQGLKAEMIVLERYQTAEELPQAEIRSIAQHRQSGCKLTNGTNGGDGGATWFGRSHTKETKDKISAKAVGRTHTEEAKKKMSEDRKGRSVSENHRKNLSAALMGHEVSEEIRQKISKSRKAFSNEEELQIFQEYNTTNTTMQKLADKYNVVRSTIFSVINKHKKDI